MLAGIKNKLKRMDNQGIFDFVDDLLAQGISLAIIGGHAVNFHGYLRTTEDIDLVFRRDAGIDQLLFERLAAWEAYWIGDEINSATGLEVTYPITLDYVRQHRLLLLGTKVGYVDLFDFLPGLPGESIDDLIATAEISEGRPYCSLEWLKRLKQASARPQDMVDLKHLP